MKRIEYSYKEWYALPTVVVEGKGEYLGLGHMSYGSCGCKVWEGGADNLVVVHRPCTQHIGNCVDVKCSNVH